MFDVLEAQKRRPAMKKISTMQAFSNEILKEQNLTIGVGLGDRWSFYCVLDEAGKIILEQKVATTPEAMKQTFGKIPRSLMALETGTHSPWVSRLLMELGHEVIVAHAQKVELITKSNRKDDRHDDAERREFRPILSVNVSSNEAQHSRIQKSRIQQGSIAISPAG
jgi:transposase